ncbi:hypothetical protein HPB51_019838 [Rhipicephalus microplus]|uniref:Uncharacterized protein n=1 Tax=Rhipicephalus microplus TaxID=6941 RepID=A0A9J6DBX6_RHIMP|nr:hypothetical protein HPB51_019838 [Rhipicephalus microplus]
MPGCYAFGCSNRTESGKAFVCIPTEKKKTSNDVRHGCTESAARTSCLRRTPACARLLQELTVVIHHFEEDDSESTSGKMECRMTSTRWRSRPNKAPREGERLQQGLAGYGHVGSDTAAPEQTNICDNIQDNIAGAYAMSTSRARCPCEAGSREKSDYLLFSKRCALVSYQVFACAYIEPKQSTACSSRNRRRKTW